VPQGLREYLRENVSPQRVWQAIEAALEGASESARVSASRRLVDALHEETAVLRREAELKTAANEARRFIASRLADRADRAEREVATGDELAELRRDADRWRQLPEHVRLEFSDRPVDHAPGGKGEAL
jgi:hypothetical protein